MPLDHTPLSVKRGLLQCTTIGSCKTSCPLFGVKRCPLFGGSVCISYSKIGWCMGQMSVRRKCPLFGASIIRGSTIHTSICSFSVVHLVGVVK